MCTFKIRETEEMRRRVLIRTQGTNFRLSLWLLILLGWSLPNLEAEPSNCLLITIDTIRADRLGCYGYQKGQTPVIDRLAREGVLFERAFSAVPLTLPAHASILTGTYPFYHGIRDNSGFVLPVRLVTWAEALKPVGYASGAFVGAFVLDSKFGLDQGFDNYFDNFDLSQFENVSPGYIQRTGDEVVKEAIEWLEGRVRKRFFAWVHLYDPHDPYAPPEPFASRHPGQPYDGEIEFTDSNLGVLFNWMRDHGAYDNTLIILVGDHGESLGEHGEDKHGFFVYNATLHVPLIIRLPQGERGGQQIAENVSIVDLFPTAMQLLKVPRDLVPEVQGTGLASLIFGRVRRSRPDLYAETFYPYLQFGWSLSERSSRAPESTSRLRFRSSTICQMILPRVTILRRPSQVWSMVSVRAWLSSSSAIRERQPLPVPK